MVVVVVVVVVVLDSYATYRFDAELYQYPSKNARLDFSMVDTKQLYS